MKNNGFTLVELIGVIALIAILAIFTVGPINSLLNKNKEKLRQQQIEKIESAAYTWIMNNTNLVSEGDKYTFITITDLTNSGIIGDSDVIDPVTNENMTGCVRARYNTSINNYEYNYTEKCSN